MSDILEAFLSQYSGDSADTYRQSAKVIAAVLRPGTDVDAVAWETMTPKDMFVLVRKLTDMYAPATTNKTLAVFRQLMKTAYLMGKMTAEDYLNLMPSNVSEKPIARKQAIPVKVARKMIRNCQSERSLRGLRDAALIALLLSTGLGRKAVAALLISDYDPDYRHILIRGKRKRSIKLSKDAARAMDEYLSEREDDNPFLFVGIPKGDKTVSDGGVTGQAIYLWLRERGEEAGYSNVSGINFRKTMVTEAMRKGVDVRKVQQKLGIGTADQVLVHDARGKQCGRNEGR